MALIFISIPFVVRTVEPVLLEFEPAMEEAGASLGASRLQVFTKVKNLRQSRRLENANRSKRVNLCTT